VEDERKQLVEARRHINELVRAARQTITFLDRISALGETKLRKILREAVRGAERFLNE
jgi:hypothetical protein